MSESLRERVIKSNISIYQIEGAELKKFIISTPETRLVCNSPEIAGFKFVDLIRTGMARAVMNLPKDKKIRKFDDKSIGVIHFLRGGLNFGLVEVLYRAYGFNRQFSTFITSQRFKRKGEWSIKQDQYRKFSIPWDANFFCGDVVATGTTLENGLEIIFEKCLEERKNIRNFILFTIGCQRAEDILRKFHRLFQKNFDYQDTYIFYLEGRFGLPISKDQFKICLPGTDLIRQPALLSPEFELSQYQKISYPLERCTIYDVGSRAFESVEHYKEVIEFWEKLSKTGMTLWEAYRERWDEKEFKSFETLVEEKRKVWKDISSRFLEKLYVAQRKCWTEEHIKKAQQKDSLKVFCHERVKHLERFLR